MNPSASQHIGIRQTQDLRQPADGGASNNQAAEGFADALENALNEVNETQSASDEKVESFLQGEDVPVHEVMVRLTEADMAMKLMTAVTTKAIQAYQEIARMQI